MPPELINKRLTIVKFFQVLLILVVFGGCLYLNDKVRDKDFLDFQSTKELKLENLNPSADNIYDFEYLDAIDTIARKVNLNEEYYSTFKSLGCYYLPPDSKKMPTITKLVSLGFQIQDMADQIKIDSILKHGEPSYNDKNEIVTWNRVAAELKEFKYK